VFTRRVSRQGLRAKAGTIAGTRKPNGYLTIWICGANHMAHRLAWLHFYGRWPAEHLDHINRVRDDNRIANLREVTFSENNQNVGLRRTSRSGYRGVTRVKAGWWARIVINGETHPLGTYGTPEEAYAAYLAAAASMHTHIPVRRPSPDGLTLNPSTVMTDYQETLQLLRRREAEIERLADQNDVLRTALERLQRFDFECRRDGIEPLPAAVVRIIDTALAA
jgi:hypothetical protein